MTPNYPLYLLVMAGVTYLLRLLPMLIFRKPIQNRFVLAFLKYVPYAVLAAMTVPAIFYATSSPISGAIGLAVALLLSFFGQGLLVVALGASAGVFLAEWIIQLL